MNSENKTTKSTEITALENTRSVKMITLAKDIGFTTANNIEFINSFYSKICDILGEAKTMKHIEALEFITANKPKDVVEVFHILHLFMLNEITAKMFKLTNNTSYVAQLQEYAKLTMKATTSYSGGMIALKTYRNGVNITKNIQNNTLNQQNNFGEVPPKPAKPKQLEEKNNMEHFNDHDKEKAKEKA